VPPGSDGTTHGYDYRIEPAGDGGCLLTFVHHGALGDGWAGGYDYETVTAAGWDMYLATLQAYLTHFSGRTARYIAAEAPAESARPEAWPRLARALGLADPVLSGAPVRIELTGAGPMEGVVDYVSRNFLGVRTAGALIRFHGRAVVGMSVAVGHHAFAGDVPVDETAAGWRAWLARSFAPGVDPGR
jgi:hypothetical protein